MGLLPAHALVGYRSQRTAGLAVHVEPVRVVEDVHLPLGDAAGDDDASPAWMPC